MTRRQFAYILLVSTIFTTILAQQNIGDACQMRHNGAPGVCKLATDCPLAHELANNGISPTVCKIPAQSNNYIFCCEISQNTVSNQPQPNENSFLNVENPDFVFPESIYRPPSPPKSHKTKSEEKCTEYNKLVSGSVSAAPLVIPDFGQEVVSVDINKCDYGISVALIVGGTPASAGEFPFMAAIGYNDENDVGWYCGGTLISEYYIVTAAHCANTKSYGAPVKVRLGDLDLKKEDDSSVYAEYDIVDIKVHNRYRPPSRYHDIALLRLSPRVEFTKFIRPACLWTKGSFDTNVTIATGWGKTGIADEQSDKLLKVVLSILDNSLCSKSYPPNARTLPNGIQPTMMCAGELKGGKDTCQGDSGGPLVVTTKGKRCVYHIVGITSFGKGCGGPNVPAVYTRVSEYVPWIENIIW